MSSTSEMTYKQRVEAFWGWFGTNAEQLADHINSAQADDGDEQSGITGAVTEVMSQWLPGFNYVFGVEASRGCAFTLSPGGDLDRRFLAEYWLSRAPKMEGWRFFSSRQPGIDVEFTIEIGGHNFNSMEARFGLEVDQEAEVIDVVVWHPSFVADGDINSQVAFVFLDEALGEVGTEMWIGKIELIEAEPKDPVAIKSLASEVVSLASMHQWEKLTPEKTYTGYSVESPGEGFARADTIAGATCHFPLVGEFMEREGLLSNDPLASYGATFAYLVIDSTEFDPENEVQRRAEIEEQLDDLLRERGSGRVLGGATGIRHAYIDLFLVDGAHSLELVQQSMELQNLATRYRVEPFFDTATV